MRELCGGVAELFPHHGAVDERFVDVQEQQFIDVGVEPFTYGRPLLGAAAVDEPLVGQLDAAGGTGVHPLGE